MLLKVMASVRFGDRYVLTSLLKSGNGVETHLALDLPTGREVVVKTIDPTVVHAAARLRFEHETRVLRELSGAGLAGLYDAGFADERLFLVQPYVPGRSLDIVLLQGRLPVETAVAVAL